MFVRIDCYLMIILWLGTMESTRRYLQRGLELERTSKGVQGKVESQTKLTSNLFRSPGAVCTKTVVQVAYGLGFRHSIYARISEKITFSMALVPWSNSSWINENHRNKRRPESVSVLRHRFWPLGHVSFWAQLRAWPEGPCLTLDHIYSRRCLG